MVRGVIYMYTGPTGKSYVGQTTREELRRKLWRSSSYHYAGDKIDRARKKYGSESFDYKILFEKDFSTKEIASIWLNVAEQYYIQLHNTVVDGYNCENGGGGNPNHTKAINHHHGGYKLSDETKKRIGESSKRRQNTPEGKAKMAAARKGIVRKKGYSVEAKYKPVVQLSLDGEYIQEFPSIKDAAKVVTTNNSNCKDNIGNVCKGKRDSACGYKWLYKEDYFTYFLNPSDDVPQRVRRALDCIAKRHAPKIKKKYIRKPQPKKEGPKINRFAQQVGQYDTNLQLVKIWRNGLDAARALGISSDNVYRSTRTLGMYKGYYWRKYHGEQVIESKPKKKIKKPALSKRIIQKDLEGNVIRIYESIGEACQIFGANRAFLSNCLNGKISKAYGYKWEFLKKE